MEVMDKTCLKNFIEIVPRCVQSDPLEVVLGILHQSECDRVVVVNAQEEPLGIIHLHKLLPYWLATQLPIPTSQGESLATNLSDLLKQPLTTIEPQRLLSELGASILEPLTCLAANLTLEKVWVKLQQIKSPLALVDSRGRFVGLLAPLKVLKFLQAAVPTKTDRLPSPDHPALSETASDFPPWHSQSPIPAQPILLSPLAQLLEQLPLPLMLQTAQGRMVTQNSAWHQQVGEILDPAWVGRDAAAEFSRHAPAPPEGTRCSVLDAGSAESTSPSLCQLGSEPNTCICTCLMKNGQERSLQFIKIPLGKALPGALLATLMRQTSGRSTEIRSAEPRSADGAEFNNAELKGFQLAALEIEPASSLHHEFEIAAANDAGLFNRLRSEKIDIRSQVTGEVLWLVMAQDVTEQQQLAKELTAKNTDLIQLNRLKDEFLACISHELKTPLTAVLGLSSLLKNQASAGLSDRQLRYAQLIYQSGRHLMTVVNNILDLTRIETGQLELTSEPVKITLVCSRAIEQVLHLKETEDPPPAGNDSTTEKPPPPVLEIDLALENLVADELRLRQMLVNLLSNALKFTDTHGQVGLKVSQWAGWIAFTVWDTGIGIPDEKQHLIFQKFQQLENPLTRRFEGTGLGLVLTQRLARLHGGDVTFTSKEGVGSRFTLLLPPIPPKHYENRAYETTDSATREDRETSADAEAATPSSIGLDRSGAVNRLVLVVETVPQFIENLTEQLSEAGYPVVVARSGTEALEKARKLQPCIIFLNPLLPLLSGWDVLTLLKSDTETCHIPAVVTATRVEKKQAYQHQADGFLSLPIQAETLQETLDRLIVESPVAPQATDAAVLNLSVLRLSPLLSDAVAHRTTADSPPTSTDLNSLLHAYQYRVLEADDLDQAELLARVWKPQVVLLDGGLANPQEYLKQLAQHAFLASLPIVTLDHAMTQAANQVPGLSVFPCLLDPTPEANAGMANAQNSSLLQAIQVAAGYAWRPLILAVDVLMLPDLAELSESEMAAPDRSHTHWAEPERAMQPREWLQVLVQYVHTAGYRSLLGRSWTEVLRQLQHKSADLLLIYWQDPAPNPVLIQAIANLHRFSTCPPILIIDRHGHPDDASYSTLPEPIRAIATQILPASTPLDTLFEQIKQMVK
jgi:signal transduction histidine kinase/CheY-like chemotaxis protein